jgi:hemolysin activation/secretion protein
LTARLPLEPTFVLRVGGQQLFGLYPFREAAFIGGVDTVRGLVRRRYTGDASAYANGELRLLLRRRDGALIPRFGVFSLVDVGRVFLSGEHSRLWHTGVGGGAWISVVDPAYMASLALVHSEGDWMLYLQGGFMF